MKFLTPAIAIALFFSACNSSTKTDSEAKKEIFADTTTNYNNSILTDTGTVTQTEELPVAPAKTITNEPRKSLATPKRQKPATTQTAPVNPAPVTSETTANTQPAVNNDPVPAVEEEKKGWSNAAKGAVIGAGAGAIGGAIISKKKGKGAIIGGVVGAAGGYIIGKNKDKKDTAR